MVGPKGILRRQIFKKVLPMFVATFLLKGGLYQMMFLLRLRLVVFVVVLRARMFEFELMLISALVKCSLVCL